MYGIMTYLECGCGLIRGGGLARCPAHRTDEGPKDQNNQVANLRRYTPTTKPQG